MICTNCLRRLARTSRTVRSTTNRGYSTPVTTQTPTSTASSPAPSGTSTSKTAAPRVPSSVPAGTPLKGLNYIKGKQDPVALEDAEYPEWLWGVLDRKKQADGAGGAAEADGDLFSKSKKQRQRAAKSLRKRVLLNPGSLAPKVPLYEQTVDLPKGDGTVKGALAAEAARGGLTKAMRDKRRSVIKEANFLKAMS